MVHRFLKVAVVAAALIAVAACETVNPYTNETQTSKAAKAKSKAKFATELEFSTGICATNSTICAGQFGRDGCGLNGLQGIGRGETKR